MATAGAIHATFQPGYGKPGAMKRAAHNDTSSRPPEDWRGAPAVRVRFGKA
jgi:hypothetical protein